jgi:MFS family permease
MPLSTYLTHRNYSIAVLAASSIFLFADQNLMAPNLTAIAAEFEFTDEQRDKKLGGDVALAFFILGCPVSFLVGWAADKYPRLPLFAITIIIGEGACAYTYWTTTYNELLITRALTGVSVGGATPLIFSLLSDM